MHREKDSLSQTEVGEEVSKCFCFRRSFCLLDPIIIYPKDSKSPKAAETGHRLISRSAKNNGSVVKKRPPYYLEFGIN